jgi:lipopolysaccharide biosynthesis glycosyltransferase
MPLAVTVTSALKNLNPDYKMILYILDGGIRAASKKKILASLDSDQLEVYWIKPSSDRIKYMLLKCQASNHPISNYYRLLLTEIIPKEYSKVIYLDTDIVVEGDLSRLWKIDIQDAYVLAVQDPVHRTLQQAAHLNRLGLVDQTASEGTDHKYLNAGVLVINLDKWRAEGIAERIIGCIIENPELPFPDQDATNLVLAGKWKELDPQWNQVHVVHFLASPEDSPYSLSKHQAAIENPHIIHYTTRPKPWGKNCIHPQRDRFFAYLDQTGWKGWRRNFWNYSTLFVRRSLRRTQVALRKAVSL